MARKARAARRPKKVLKRKGIRKRVCRFCAGKIRYVDYKDVDLLRQFLSARGRIRSRAVTGTCQRHQAGVALGIKNAREMALLPYVATQQPTMEVRPKRRRSRS